MRERRDMVTTQPMTNKRGEKMKEKKRGRDGEYLLCPRREDGACQMYKGAEGIHKIQDERQKKM